jgi:hypothetical protein
MPASPANIARFTTDGVVLTAEDTAIRDAHVDAIDGGDEEIEMFFTDPDDAEVLLNERFDILSLVSAVHEGIELDESLGLGTTIALTPTVPCFQAVDASRGIDVVARTRAFAYEGETDRYSVEVLE